MTSGIVDCRGLELHLGDTVVYASLSGSSTAVVLGKVVKLLPSKGDPVHYSTPHKVTVDRHFNSRYGPERSENRKSTIAAKNVMRVQTPFTVQECP